MARSVSCTIERRLLLNYRIDPSAVESLLPAPLSPQIVNGYAVGGICLIRLSQTRLGRIPPVPGARTENAAHRLAVQWEDDEGTRVGVYIPRRDTNSWISSIGGGKVFPGSYQLANFDVTESDNRVDIRVRSRDGQTDVTVRSGIAPTFRSQLFYGLSAATEFFKAGAIGFSPDGKSDLDCVRLHASDWNANPVEVDEVHSNFFDDPTIFPAGLCTFDSALIMRNVRAKWTVEGRTDGVLTPMGVK
jgi:hypothetical protein